ncbi:MAG: HD domain-containing phosphohydrolase [Thermodesulfobacteriota bacterium]|nr:HD domain-containing phosphohydrolase [Thermodesulfobacteriota bacterium]
MAITLQRMTVNPVTLTFNRECAAYEAPFHEHYVKQSLKPFRQAILLAIAVWLPFGLLDVKLNPHGTTAVWMIRYGLMTPFMVFGLIISFTGVFKKHMQPLVATSVIICGTGIALMIPAAEAPLRHFYYAGLLVIFMFSYTLLRLRFLWATLAGWAVVAIYETVAVMIDTPPVILLNNSFFFISANIVGMFACYAIEYSHRNDFFLARKLEEQQMAIHRANQELEGNVRQRTQQLIKLNEDLNLTIAGHRHTEARLRESEEKYRTIITSIKEGVYEIDLSGNFMFVNDAVMHIFNCKTQAELLARNFRDFMTHEEAKKTLPVYNEIYRTGVPAQNINIEIVDLNNIPRFLEVSAALIDDGKGGPTGFRGIIRDITRKRQVEKKLLEYYENIKATRAMTILGLARLAEYRDKKTGEHLERMMKYTKVLAQALSLKPKYSDYITAEYIEDIGISSMLHDIGKVGITDEILLKPGPLTTDEYEKVKEHTTLGGEALQSVESEVRGKSFLTLGKEICFRHHERWDGSGYPEGLKGEDIPLSARIVALADVYDALTSDRVYRDATTHEKAVDVISKERGRHFDPDIVDVFLENADTFKEILLSNRSMDNPFTSTQNHPNHSGGSE